MTTINVGCGSDTWGDVRLDYSRKPKQYYLVGHSSSANIIADARHVPFFDKCFSELRAHHVLEHIKDWKKALQEWCRVAEKVEIRFPTNSNIAVITLKCFFQDVDFRRLNRLLPNNFNSFTRLREQSVEHLWQVEPELVVETLRAQGFTHWNLKKINAPFLQMKLPFFKSDLKTIRLTVPHSWNIEAW